MDNDSYCVYCHTSPSGKRYVGQSTNAKRRWNGFGKEYKNSVRFYNAIKKYGWDNFKHEIIKSNLTHEEANRLEIELINKWNLTNKNYGYNLSVGGTGGNQKPTRRVKMYSLDFHFIKEFDSVSSAAYFVGCHKNGIIACCKKRQKRTGGYHWCYSDENIDLEYIKLNHRSRNNARRSKIKVKDINTNEVHTFESIKKCVEYYGFVYSTFVYALNYNSKNRYKNYIFERIIE